MRIKMRIVAWRLTQHFFHLPQGASPAVATLVAASIVNAFGRWVLQEEKTDRTTTADTTQFWRFRWRDTKRNWNYWEIRNTAYGGRLCLELPEHNHDTGTPLQARECNHADNANNQQWRPRA